MTKLIEFKTWLVQCCLDGKMKLGLTSLDIAIALVEELERQLVDIEVDRGVFKD